MAPKQSDLRPWPYSAGQWGVNRVRVYDRDDSSCIQIEWTDRWVDAKGHPQSERIQQSLTSVTGEPVTDRTLARDIADAIAEARRVKANQRVRDRLMNRAGWKQGESEDLARVVTDLVTRGRKG